MSNTTDDNFDNLLEFEISYDPNIIENKQSKSWSFAIMWFKNEFIDVLVFITEKYIYIRPLQIHKSFEFERLFGFDIESRDFDNKKIIKIKHKHFPIHPWAHLENRITVYDHLIREKLYPELISKYKLK